jgi:DNA-binding beta-propeller fold protein YncE
VNDLYRLVPGDTARAAVRVGLSNVADVEVEEFTRTLWVSERGQPRASAGRLTRLASDGSVLASVTGLEPYGIAIDPGTDRAWVSDLASNRLLLVDAAGLVRRRSPPISVPYGVIAHLR